MRARWLVTGVVLLAGVASGSGQLGAQDVTGFDAHIQSGTCAAPTNRVRVDLKSGRDDDIEPYLAIPADGGEPVVLGYFGAAEAPGFGVAAIHTDQRFSLVVTTGDGGDPMACGDLLQPAADRYVETGQALVQLLPVGTSTLQGVAVVQRRQLERERDITPTLVQILLTDDDPTSGPTETVDGYDGYVQGGPCDAPTDRVRTDLVSRGVHDVRPYLAAPGDGGPPVVVAYYGAPGAPGFGLAAAYSDQQFSVVISDTNAREPVACGDILEPDDDDFTTAGLALVRLAPVDSTGVSGYALIERIGLQRELVVTPTRVRIVLFAAPIAD